MSASWVFAALLTASFSAGAAAPRQTESVSANGHHDFSCGQNSLYLLLRLLGQPVPLEDVKKRLTTGEKGECSMAQLQEAASEFGVSLVGRRLRGKDVSGVDVPFIVLLEHPNEMHGHYLVSRWLDGKSMLQALDPPHEPSLIPESEVLGSDGPPFACLVPVVRGSSMAPWAAAAFGIAAIGILVIGLRKGGLRLPLRPRKSPV